MRGTIMIPRKIISKRIVGSRRGSKGVTLIEILIAVLLLSLGLLGMAGLQIRALQGNHSAAQRSQAVMLSYFIIEAMRVDSASAKALNYNTGSLDANGNVDNSICNVDAITGTALSDNNQKAWISAIKGSLGDATDTSTCGAINCDADGICTVQVRWDDSLAGGLGSQAVTTSTRL
ncbi:type IV pilus modification protein PilV [Curvibacter sp. APW13]|uniref:type IV pilus modification protein PilV n=1 Tax=Curvibacter sp. APW13 TaxID=3077236 RepID=UPI0028DF539D|nr:type IV pilus modification protein PilV [Curvibacter sp. APW13]MDT8991413.1 type IV pilus modification protein PilV [Curvibacter sp. APW13]